MWQPKIYLTDGPCAGMTLPRPEKHKFRANEGIAVRLDDGSGYALYSRVKGTHRFAFDEFLKPDDVRRVFPDRRKGRSK